MKKFAAIAIVAIVAIAAAAPLSMGLFMKSGLSALIEKINAKVAKISGGSAPFELRLDSYEGGALGAKSVVSLDLGGLDPSGESGVLVIESEFSYGWYFSDSFPFVSLVKGRDTLRISDAIVASGGEELARIFGNGILAESQTRLIPFIYLSGRYAFTGIDFREEMFQFTFKPSTIQLNTNFTKDFYLASHSPLITIGDKDGKFHLEEMFFEADGDMFNIVGNAELELAIKKIEIGSFFSMDRLLIKDSRKREGNALNALLKISADTLTIERDCKSCLEAEKPIIITKPLISITANNIDAKTFADLSDRLKSIQEQLANDPSSKTLVTIKALKMIPDMASMFDKGAVVAIKAEALIDNDALVSFFIDLRGDSSVAIPKFRVDKEYLDELGAKLIKKAVINSELSIHQKALDTMKLSAQQLETFRELGYIE
ncbi:MAG: hypothetical protein LBE89_08160, partial [Helicobacteraceae bacterium]|nr:hypothetical protein [Helicobacteraceae bacterium]